IRYSIGSNPRPREPAIAAPVSGSRSCVPSSSCMAARCASSRFRGRVRRWYAFFRSRPPLRSVPPNRGMTAQTSMQSNPPGAASFTIALASEEATRRLAVDLANLLAPGDFVALAGDLGAGKTTLVRAMIAHLAGGAEIEVPSPTFTLVQTYDLPQFALVHA